MLPFASPDLILVPQTLFRREVFPFPHYPIIIALTFFKESDVLALYLKNNKLLGGDVSYFQNP
jgi:hypothetical protein